jgi:hypothetical protein
MIKRKDRKAVETFYTLVISINPFLSSDKRVNPDMVRNLLLLFEEEINNQNLINYDSILEVVSKKLNLPGFIVEPFLEMYATAYFTMTDRKFIRICKTCGGAHNLHDIQQCGMRESAVIKTAIGIVLVDDKEDLTQVKN